MGELVRQLVDRNRETIVQRLPRYLTPEQFIALCYNLDRNPKLAAVAQRNPESLLNAILKAADCGLMIGSAYDHCAIAPFGDEVQLMIQYRGLVYQLIHAGAVLKINAACVYDGDDFELRLGDEELLRHRPQLDDERRNDARWLFDKKNIRGAYAVAWLPMELRPGVPLMQHRWCPLGEIERARLVSRNADGPAWSQHYPAMAMKTAVRRLAKFIEVCGPSEENREAWQRFGRTMEVEDAEYKHVEESAGDDDLPGKTREKPAKAAAPRPAARAAEVVSAERSTPLPDNGGGRRRPPVATAPPPPPLKEVPPPPAAPPPTDELISADTQNDLIDKTTGAGLKPTWLFEHIQEKYGVGALKHLRQSQANEIEQYLRTLET